MSYSRTVRPSSGTTAARGRVSPRRGPYSYGARPHQPQSFGGHVASGGRPSRSSHTYAGSPASEQGDGAMDMGQDEASMNEGTSYGGQRSQRVMQSHGAHYVLPPDPSKNSQLKQTASREENEYDSYKQEKREQTARNLEYQPPRAVGGARLSQSELDEARRKQERVQQMEAKFAAVRQREKREQYRRQEKERKEKEMEQKKAVQREKAIRLEQRQKEQQQAQLEETRRKRLESLESRGIV